MVGEGRGTSGAWKTASKGCQTEKIMRSDEVGGGQEAAKALESIGLASSIRRHGYRYRGYFCHPCIRGYWIQWIQLYRGYHSMCILAKRWYPRLYPF